MISEEIISLIKETLDDGIPVAISGNSKSGRKEAAEKIFSDHDPSHCINENLTCQIRQSDNAAVYFFNCFSVNILSFSPDLAEKRYRKNGKTTESFDREDYEESVNLLKRAAQAQKILVVEIIDKACGETTVNRVYWIEKTEEAYESRTVFIYDYRLNELKQV